MAKQWEVRHMWRSPSVNAWICPDTAELINDISDAERDHAIRSGFIREMTALTPEQAAQLEPKASISIRGNPSTAARLTAKSLARQKAQKESQSASTGSASTKKGDR